MTATAEQFDERRPPPRGENPSSPAARSAVRWLTAESLQRRKFPPVQWILPRYWPEGLTVLAGAPKLGKSWLLLDAAMAIASGGECLGEAAAQGSVLYCALEDNERRLQSRLKKIAPCGDWPSALQYATEWPRLDQGGEDAIRRWIAETENPRAVFLDTLACVKPANPSQRSAYDQDTAALRGLHEIASSSGVSIGVATHTRKAEAEDPMEKVSGTLGLTGVADTVMVMSRIMGTSNVTLYGRGRDVAEYEAAIEFDKETCRWRALDAPPDQAFASRERAEVLQVIAKQGEVGPKELADALGIDPEAAKKRLQRGLQRGWLAREGHGRYSAPPVPSVPLSPSEEF